MAANSSDNEVAAKIGAQLQSLLKIPPIKKDEQKPVDQKAAVKVDGKENRQNCLGSNLSKAPPMVMKPDPIPRDRFGRPFQSLDKRVRGRDFHNGPKRYGSGPHRGGEMMHPVNTPEGSREVTPHSSNNIGPPHFAQKGRMPPIRHMPAAGPPIAPPVSVVTTTSTFTDRFSEARKGSPFGTPFDNAPRFSNDSPNMDIRLIEPGVRQLIRRADCPYDIKEFMNEFHERNVNPNSKFLLILKKHCVCFLVKKNLKFPRAKYYCICCNYHMDNLYATLNHILQDRHITAARLYHISKTISLLPSDYPNEQVTNLTEFLIKTTELQGLTSAERKERLFLVRRINDALKGANFDCQASLFGSSVSGFGLVGSNVNINIDVALEVAVNTELPNEQPSSPKTPIAANPAEFLEISAKLVALIKKMPHVVGHTVKEACTTKCISILFEEEKTRASCIVHYNNSSAVQAAQLFAEYEKLDDRVRPLVTCFRYWAKVCDIDDPEKGFLPPHCYAIMVIHFLIRKKNILPNLHLVPRVDANRLFSTAEEAKLHWTSSNKNDEPLGKLWIDLLRYFAHEFCYKTQIVSVSREDTTIPKNEKQWNRKLCIEDPIIPKSNLARIVTNNKICDYIMDRIKFAGVYFNIPRKASGPLFYGIFNSSSVDESDIFRTNLEGSKKASGTATLQKMVRQIQKGPSGANADPNADWEDGKKLRQFPHFDSEVRMAKICVGSICQPYVHCDDIKHCMDLLYKNEYYYDFKPENFGDGTPPPVICKSCGVEGHLRNNCPEEAIPPFSPVDYPSPLTFSRMSNAIYQVYEREALDRNDVNIRTKIMDEVRKILLPCFPSVCLTLFGSTFNGFGMHSSDVDICLTFNDIMVPPDQRGIKFLHVNSVLENIVEALKVSGKMTDILSIPSAKVPIVKFRNIEYKLEGDISLYNRLSIFNTELLRLYVDIDSRVAQLGLFLKKLVKLCDVGDASKGSLSSYSYILMLIHFLQNHSVPVLPVLQELRVPGSQCAIDLQCDNHIVKYSKDLKRIVQVWSGYGKNKESVSQLWLSFLNYYVEHFDTEKYVITISQSVPLTRSAKSWFTDAIAIEDPFDKTHNLGLGLTRRMSVHIIRTFQKFRIFFHRSTDHLRNELNFTDYYVDARNVRDGNPPIDRQCRLCNRIGHFARSCTYVNKPEDGSRRADDDDGKSSGLDSVDEISRETAQLTVTNGPHKEEAQNKEVSMEKMSDNSPEIKKNSWESPSKNPSHVPHPKKLPWNPKVQNGKLSKPPQAVDVLKPGANCPPTGVKQLQPLVMEANRKDNFDPSDVKPVKEVMFFGDIGGANAEGEQIKAMLQKNQGVTFTFGVGNQPQHHHHMEQRPVFDSVPPPEVMQNSGVGKMIGQPPPGFCPPGNIYIAKVPPTNPVQFVPDQGPRPIANPGNQPFNMQPIAMPIPTPPPSAPWPNQVAMPVRFQPVIPVGAIPYDGRQPINGENPERPSAPPHHMAGGPAQPPPGFAPLPNVTVTNNNCIQPSEMMRNYPPQSFARVPAMSMYSVAPVVPVPGLAYQAGVSRQAISSPSVSVAVSESMEQVLAYRPMAGEAPMPHVTVHYDANMIAATSPNVPGMIAHHHMNNQIAPIAAGFHAQQHPIPVNTPVPVEQLENGEEVVTQASYVKMPTTGGGEQLFYSADYAPGNMVIGNASIASFGHHVDPIMRTSQAHQSPVVSALQMHHSQHHPMQMQGGHYHHVRPFMPMNPMNFPAGSHYAYQSLPGPPPQQQGLPPHATDHMMPVHHGGEQVNQVAPPPSAPAQLEAKHVK